MVRTHFISNFPAPLYYLFRVAIKHGYSTHNPAYLTCRSVHPGSKLVAAVRVSSHLQTGRPFGLFITGG